MPNYPANGTLPFRHLSNTMPGNNLITSPVIRYTIKKHYSSKESVQYEKSAKMPTHPPNIAETMTNAMIYSLKVYSISQLLTCSLYRYDVQPPHSLKVPTVVSQQRKVVPYRRRANQEIKVFETVPIRSEPATLRGEYAANRIVKRRNLFDIIQKSQQAPLRSLPVRIAKYSVVEFSKRYNTHADALRQQLIEALHYRLMSAHIINCPVRINKILHRPLALLPSRPAMARFVDLPLHLFPIHSDPIVRGATYADDALARRPGVAFQIVVPQDPLTAVMVSCVNFPRVGMSGGNPITHIAAIAQLHQRAPPPP